MGLIKFLKEKFSKRKKENDQQKQEPESEAQAEVSAEPESAPEEPKQVESAPVEEPVSEPVIEQIEEQPEQEHEEEIVPEPVQEVQEPISEPEEKIEEPAKPAGQPKQSQKPKQPEPAKKEPKKEPVDQREEERKTEDRYVAGLDKSRVGFTDRLKKLANSNKEVNDEYFDQLERILIEADVGVSLSLELIEQTETQARAERITDPKEINELLIDKMFIGYANEGGSFATDLQLAKEGPTIVFMCGVNGGGKTTTVAKLANKYKQKGKKVLLVAADTFRAGAVEQLTFWANKVGVDIISRPNADPASLCYDALRKAVDEHYDIVFVDTAGRLQNKVALMDELRKIVRVMKKVIPDAPHEALLVIDANTGQNGIDQAKIFKDAAELTGIIITKMDGTSKGGIILSIRKQLALPVRYIGLGEKMDDLEEFDLDKYLYGLLIGDEED